MVGVRGDRVIGRALMGESREIPAMTGGMNDRCVFRVGGRANHDHAQVGIHAGKAVAAFVQDCDAALRAASLAGKRDPVVTRLFVTRKWAFGDTTGAAADNARLAERGGNVELEQLAFLLPIETEQEFDRSDRRVVNDVEPDLRVSPDSFLPMNGAKWSGFNDPALDQARASQLMGKPIHTMRPGIALILDDQQPKRCRQQLHSIRGFP